MTRPGLTQVELEARYLRSRRSLLDTLVQLRGLVMMRVTEAP